MVFTSVPNPLYLDPPNWNQQQAHHQGSSTSDVHQLSQSSAIVPSAQTTEGGSEPRSGGGSMAERARLAKIPQPEAALKCPRCDSTNTKFCYFNNYSLTQPRHFCKTCRRYWTRGGALRSVPVGGGCRRNKRSNNKPSSTTSSSSSKLLPTTAAVTSPLAALSASSAGAFRPAQPQFFPPWHHLSEYGFAGLHHAVPTSVDAAENMGLEQWRIHQIQQFPFIEGLAETPAAMVPGLYPFDGELVGGHGDQEQDGKMTTVKMEECSQPSATSAGMHLPRQFFGLARNDGQMWQGVGGGHEGDHSGGGGIGGRWISTDNLSGFTSSSTGNFL